MKILTQGKKPEPPPVGWWHGKEMKCAGCGTIFIVEKGDHVSSSAVNSIRRIVSTLCPVCKRFVYHFYEKTNQGHYASAI